MTFNAISSLSHSLSASYKVYLNDHNYEVIALSVTVVSQSAKNRSHTHNTYTDTQRSQLLWELFVCICSCPQFILFVLIKGSDTLVCELAFVG